MSAILVIADDFTGAAEMGAVAWRYGLSAVVQSKPGWSEDADVLALDTNTRSLGQGEAAGRLRRLLSRCERIPNSVFKKVDSAMRGPIVDELQVLMEFLGRERALLVPANPALGRIIRNGRYLIGDTPIHETDFRQDPQHPIRSSDVRMILRSQSCGGRPGGQEDGRERPPAGTQESAIAGAPLIRLYHRKIGERLPRRGIVVGDVFRESHLLSWARRLDSKTLAAGAAQFFAAYLETVEKRRVKSRSSPVLPEKASTLFVSGSSSAYSRRLSRQFKSKGHPVHPMPVALFEGSDDPAMIRHWANTVLNSLESISPARLVIGGEILTDPKAPGRLTEILSRAVEIVVLAGAVQVLCIEGGATMSALLRRQGWDRMPVCGELGPGVVLLQPSGETAPLVVTKPGSYPWPRSVWPGG